MQSISGVSVIIPTFNSAELLALTLGDLVAQKSVAVPFEVIVCDDGSTDNTKSICNGYSHLLDLKYFYQDRKGFRVAAARNMGARAACFDLIIFLDAGMCVSSALIEIHYKAHSAKANLALIGISYGVNAYDTLCEEILLSNFVRGDADASLRKMSAHSSIEDCRSPFLRSIDHQLSRSAIPWILFWTGHVSVVRSAFEAVGGFDELFTSWGGEDVELGLRLHRHGCIFDLVPGVHSIHFPHDRDGSSKRKDSRLNKLYINKKHNTDVTRLMIEFDWEELLHLPQFRLEATR